MEVLINDLAGVADDIAHDIRTPLARARIALERSRINATSIGPLQRVVDAAVGDIDRALAIVTALLRIRAIEHIRRRESFEQVDLAAIVNDVGDFYRPIAEENGLSLDVELLIERTLQADRDLLTEAIANLVDNAVKFTPSGGRVTLSLLEESGESLIRVSDTGPGIHDSERDLVMRRFYRSDSSRHAAGNGLGLSLVSAVVRLHGFHFVIGRGPGFTAEIHCEDALWRPVPDHGHY
jgi:signal transduction histidine kinase